MKKQKKALRMITFLLILNLIPIVVPLVNTTNVHDFLTSITNIDDKDWDDTNYRSVSKHFFIKREGNILLISTDKQMDDFSIQIKDAQENIMYTEAHLSLPAEGIYPIEISDWANGVYTVTLCQDGKYVICQFTK